MAGSLTFIWVWLRSLWFILALYYTYTHRQDHLCLSLYISLKELIWYWARMFFCRHFFSTTPSIQPLQRQVLFKCRNKRAQIVMHFCNSQVFCLVDNRRSTTRSKAPFIRPSTRIKRARRHLITVIHASAWVQHLWTYSAICALRPIDRHVTQFNSIQFNGFYFKQLGKIWPDARTCLKHLHFTSILGPTNMHSKQWHQLKLIAFLQCSWRKMKKEMVFDTFERFEFCMCIFLWREQYPDDWKKGSLLSRCVSLMKNVFG